MKKYKSVLLVDDDNVSCFINDRILRTFGLTESIHTVYNGKEALDFLKEHNDDQEVFPDLILLDVHMPVMNGFEFMEEFSKTSFNGPSPEVIILTSSSNPVDQEKAEQYTVLAYLNKPLRFEELNRLFAKEKNPQVQGI